MTQYIKRLYESAWLDILPLRLQQFNDLQAFLPRFIKELLPLVFIMPEAELD